MNIKIGNPQQILLFLLLLFLMNSLILLNVPILRQIFIIFFITFIPGLILVRLFKLDYMPILKKGVISLGLSISFLLLFGLLLNSLYPLILKPLSLTPLLISFDIVVLIMIGANYFLNKKNIEIDINFKSKYELLPFFLPFLAILGTYIMNTYENNLILLLMLFIIPIYVIFITINKKMNYTIAIWTISLSMILMHGLTSNHLMGVDIFNEFYSFKLTLTNFHWDILRYYSNSNAVLSVTILPTIYYVLSNIREEYIFKLVFAVIGSFIPLTVYVISKQYIDVKYAFFAALFFIFQNAFYINLLSSTKTLFAILFFTLSFMVFFDRNIPELQKRIIFILFMISVILSHYTTAYVFLLILTGILVINFMLKYYDKYLPYIKHSDSKFTKKVIKFYYDHKISLNPDSPTKINRNSHPKNINNIVSVTLVLLIFVLIFFWFGQITGNPFNSGFKIINNAFQNLGNLFVQEFRAPTQLAVLGLGVSKIPQIINTIVYDIIFLTIGIGLISLITKYIKIKNINREFLISIFVSTTIVFLFFVLPVLSTSYGGSRLFIQLSIFLSFAFVAGGITIAKIIKKPDKSVLIILILLISLFSCSTYLVYHAFGTPISPDFEKTGIGRGQMYIYDQDIATSNWLDEYRNEKLKIFTDKYGTHVLSIGLNNSTNDPFTVGDNNFFYKNESITKGYIFLRKYNVNGIVFTSANGEEELSNYDNLFNDKLKVYDNGGGNVWI